ncbi:MAG: dephospho-CoA kinase [Bdellovibrionaceae bacterium]|nr:dephospho-CoA kinase [Pseudobdellovibrionaceae bacterium]
MKWIGLTGGMGSGKSAVTALLRARGFTVIDADVVARKVVEPGTPGLAQVVQAFGPGVLNAEGELDRKKLAAQVFGKPDELRRLEMILHPLIQQKVADRRQEAAARGEALVFYDVPLLFEKNLGAQFDAVVVVWSTQAQQIERSMKRDGASREDVERRLSAQIPLAEKKLKADVLIDNSGTLESLPVRVDTALKALG